MDKTTSSEIISAVNLAAGYGTRILWRNANFTIRRGEFVGLLGPNGAGKTTLFRLLLGLSRPLEGNLKLFGQSPKKGNPHIGYVPQRHPVDSEVRIEVLEFVRLGLNGTRWGLGTPARAKEERRLSLQTLRLIDAENLAHRALGELSGGELQRIFLAQALVSKPDILLLDEPLANLDIRRETELIQLVRNVVQSEQIAALLIAHNINPLLPAVDRIIYVVNGKVATGKVEEVVTTKTLSELYGAPVEVLRDSRGRLAVLGTEEAAHHD